MVFGLVSAIAGFVKVRFLVDKAVIDNLAFRMHYRITSAIFFLFCILCTANSLLGPPIQCLYDDKKNEHVINTYCWIMSTFTVRQLENSELQLGINVPHHGVGPEIHDDEDSKRYHTYYQWVPFVLFLQGLAFYVPHLLWKTMEGGKVRMISEGLRGVMAGTCDQRQNTRSRLVRYIIESVSLHNIYAIGYFICEILNLINVLLNVYLTDKFLGGMFFRYGMDNIELTGNEPYNYGMARIFPRVTKCTFHKYGPSGTIQKHDYLCVLALNIINEKLYLFLWYWFIILVAVSGLAVMYTLTILLFPGIRKTILERRFKFHSPQGADIVVARSRYGDFFLLHLLGQNINSIVFGDILNDLSHEMSSHKSAPPPGRLERIPMYPANFQAE